MSDTVLDNAVLTEALTLVKSPLRQRAMRGLPTAIAVSAALHLVFVIAVVVRSNNEPPAHLNTERLITTRLVKLGEKERPKNFLPRLPTSPPPPKPKEAAVQPLAPPRDKPDAKKEDEKRQKDLTERIDRVSRMQDALSRVSKKPDDEGFKDGSAKGTVSTFTEQVIGNRYATEIKEAIMRNFVVPTIVDKDQCARLKAVALIKVGADGAIVAMSIDSTSGNATYDQALLQAIQRTRILPPPPSEIAERMLADGIELHAPCKTS